MLVRLVDKQRRAVSVVKTALQGAGITGRSVCISVDNWSHSYGAVTANIAVFVSAPDGGNVEPYYETGSSIAEAVRKTIDSIKGGTNKNGTKTDDQSEVAPF